VRHEAVPLQCERDNESLGDEKRERPVLMFFQF
jgi:hypothetical protein